MAASSCPEQARLAFSAIIASEAIQILDRHGPPCFARATLAMTDGVAWHQSARCETVDLTADESTAA